MAGKGTGAKTATGWIRTVMSLAAQSQSLLTAKGTSVSAVLACLPPAAFPPAPWEGFVVTCFWDYCLFLYIVFLGTLKRIRLVISVISGKEFSFVV